MKPLVIAVIASCLTAPVAAQDAEVGTGLFLTYCASCHGETAMGDGPMTEILTVSVPDLTRLAERNGGVFPTAQVVFRIDGRDPLPAHGGPMPVYGDVLEETMATMKTPGGQPILAGQGIVDLVAHLMALQR